MTMTPDVNVVLLDFKDTKPNEMVTENEDGSYTIFVNARLSHDGRMRAYQHAMEHINRNDFQKDDVQQIEAVAHDILTEKVEQPVIPPEKVEAILEKIRIEREHIRQAREQYEEDMRYLRGMYDSFTLAEHRWLYRHDL